MNKPTSTHSFQVQGMRCGHCEMAVINAITDRDADALVTVDRSDGPLAHVTIVSHMNADSLKALIEAEGYPLAA